MCVLCELLEGGSSWSYGVMVSTLDFESSDPGSNPGRTLFFVCVVCVVASCGGVWRVVVVCCVCCGGLWWCVDTRRVVRRRAAQKRQGSGLMV